MTAVKKHVEKKERAAGIIPEKDKMNIDSAEGGTDATLNAKTGIPWSRKLGWLTKMLWGGALLLCIEHIWHGEVVPWPPFLTAMSTPGDVGPMLHEIATFGTTMAVFVTAVWFVMVMVADHKYAKTISEADIKA